MITSSLSCSCNFKTHSPLLGLPIVPYAMCKIHIRDFICKKRMKKTNFGQTLKKPYLKTLSSNIGPAFIGRSGIIIALFVLLSGFLNPSDKPNLNTDLSPPYLCCETPWADSVFTSLNAEERIAQLFMVAAYSNKGPDHETKIVSLIE